MPERLKIVPLDDFTPFRVQTDLKRCLEGWICQPDKGGWIFRRIVEEKRWDLLISRERREVYLIPFIPQRSRGLRLTTLCQVQFNPVQGSMTFFNGWGDYFAVAEGGRLFSLQFVRQQKFPKEIRVE